MTSLVDLDGLGVQLGGTPVLRNLSLSVSTGTSAGVVGPNGSGKTTLIRVLATLIRPSNGGGIVLGAQLGSPEVYEVRERIGLISHRPALYGELTLRENLEFVASVSRSSSERVTSALEVVGLRKAADRRADHSSWGMQRRVEFARLLLTKPDLVLLDEPQAGLDKPASELVGAVVERVHDRGGAVVVASHQTETLVGVTEVIYELGDGNLSRKEEIPA